MWQPVVSGIGIGAVYALIALGMSTTYAVTRVINLAQGGLVVLTQTRYVAGTRVLSATAMGVLLERTTLGLRLRATAMNAEAARLSGVSSTTVRSLVFALSGALAGLAGAMIIPLTFIRFDTM